MSEETDTTPSTNRNGGLTAVRHAIDRVTFDGCSTRSPTTRPARGSSCASRPSGEPSLHAHPNALEIVYVLSGRLHVRVSSEDFDLDAGDYVAINRADPHLLEGDDEQRHGE